MALSKFEHVKITGVSAVVPSKEISIYDEAQYYGNSVKKIDRMRKMVGFNTRRVVDDFTTPADLALCAARNLIESSKVDKDSIDALILVLQFPDCVAPASAFRLHSELGLKQTCMSFDVNLGCPGWVYGLQLAHALIESGANRKVLLLVGDTPSTKVDIADRSSAPLFGDAGAATLLEYSPSISEPSYFNLGSDGSGYEAIITPAGGARLPFKFDACHTREYNDMLTVPMISKSGHITNLTRKQMDGMKVFKFTTTTVPREIKSLMSYSRFAPSDIDKLVLHQANKQIVESVCELSGFPLDKTSSATFEKYGNQTVSSIPVALCHTLSGEISSETGIRVLCSGFGIGLAWGSCIMRLNGVACAGVSEFRLTEQPKSRTELIDYWKNRIEGKNENNPK